MERQEDTQPQQPDQTNAVNELARQLAEAEMRGYKRGLNEQITAMMAEPAVFEPLAGTRRRSVWDR